MTERRMLLAKNKGGEVGTAVNKILYSAIMTPQKEGLRSGGESFYYFVGEANVS